MLKIRVIAVCCLVPLIVGGCSFVQIPVPVMLPSTVGNLEVTAGQTVQRSSSITVDVGDVSAGSGTLALSPDAISVTLANTTGQKGGANLQAANTLMVTGWIAGPDTLDTVCGGGDEYGPFTVDLDENGGVTGVSPSSVSLTRNTVNLLNSGEFTICLSVESTVDATVSISRLNFTFGL